MIPVIPGARWDWDLATLILRDHLSCPWPGFSRLCLSILVPTFPCAVSTSLRNDALPILCLKHAAVLDSWYLWDGQIVGHCSKKENGLFYELVL